MARSGRPQHGERQAAGHCHGHCAVDRSTVSQLSADAESPAPSRTCGGEAAAVAAAERRGERRENRRADHPLRRAGAGDERDAGDVAQVQRGAGAQFAVLVDAPAPGAAVERGAAGMSLAGVQSHETQRLTDKDGCRIVLRRPRVLTSTATATGNGQGERDERGNGQLESALHEPLRPISAVIGTVDGNALGCAGR